MARTPSTPESAAPQQEYFYAGGNEFLPITIRASSQAEADGKYAVERVPVSNTQVAQPESQEE